MQKMARQLIFLIFILLFQSFTSLHVHAEESDINVSPAVIENNKKDDVLKTQNDGEKNSIAKSNRKFGPAVNATTNSTTNPEGSFGRSVIRLFLTTLFLIGFIVASLWAIKRLGRRFGAIPNDTLIKVINRVQIDQRNALILVRVYEQELLLGIGPNSISVLNKYNTLTQNEEEDTEENAELTQVTQLGGGSR